MKKLLLSLLTLLLIPVFCFAQDVIITKSGDEIKSKVVEITPDMIKYKKYGKDESPIISIYKDDVFMIKYANGEKEMLNSTTKQTKPKENAIEETHQQTNPIIPKKSSILENNSDYSTYARGKDDAKIYYRAYKPAATVTIATSLVFGGIVGLAPAIWCSSTTPDIDRLGVPDETLLRNTSYMNGYKYQAKKMKSKKVWINYAIAASINLAAGIYLITLSHQQ